MFANLINIPNKILFQFLRIFFCRKSRVISNFSNRVPQSVFPPRSREMRLDVPSSISFVRENHIQLLGLNSGRYTTSSIESSTLSNFPAAIKNSIVSKKIFLFCHLDLLFHPRRKGRQKGDCLFRSFTLGFFLFSILLFS